MGSLETLEETLGYSFHDRALLKEASTHPSLGKENSYQRLEFLGDAVLGLAVANLLFDLYPDEQEGSLAKRYAGLVCGTMLAEIAREWRLGDYIHMTESDIASGGRDIVSNLEDACEAVIGAIYLDGGMEPVKNLVARYWKSRALENTTPPRDAKSSLQEWAQGRGMALPVYNEVKCEGPAHAPVFTIEVSLKGIAPQSATGRTKREAEQLAAAAMLEYIESSNA